MKLAMGSIWESVYILVLIMVFWDVRKEGGIGI
jgi:hypothetical protein